MTSVSEDFTSISEEFNLRAREIVYPDHRVADRTSAMEEYRAKHRELRVQFAEALRKQYLLEEAGADAGLSQWIFSVAWSDGHSEGYVSVEDRYETLAAIANYAFSAGQRAKAKD